MKIKTIKLKLAKVSISVFKLFLKLLFFGFFQGDLQKYLNVLKTGFRKLNRSRFFKLLAFSPPSQNVVLVIKSGTFIPEFYYFSSQRDDLQYSSRLDFRDWELITLNFFFLLARNRKNILDIGSYSGIYAVIAGLANPSAAVFAFEPNSDSRSMIARNVELNGLISQISVEEFGLGDRIGKFKLFKHNQNLVNSGASMLKESEIFEQVEVRTLDVFLSNTSVDLIKIDVEGFETNIFRGGINLLANSSAIVISEALSSVELDHQAQVLLNYGYAKPIQISEVGSDSRNFIWHKPSDLSEVTYNLNLARMKCASQVMR